MPITVTALQAALNNGIKSYDLYPLGWKASTDVYNKLLIQIFGSSVLSTQNLHGGTSSVAATGFTSAANTGDAAPNFKVKSYLGAPAVCPVGTSGTVAKIAFALVDPDSSFLVNITSETAYSTVSHVWPNGSTTIPEFDAPRYEGDIFMVITVSPGISVTSGGYLTVKGYTGVGGSDSFTYVTLQSGS